MQEAYPDGLAVCSSTTEQEMQKTHSFVGVRA